MGILPGKVQFKDETGAKQDEKQERSRDHKSTQDPPLPGTFSRGEFSAQLSFQTLAMSARRGIKFSEGREGNAHVPGKVQQFIIVRGGFIDSIYDLVKTV